MPALRKSMPLILALALLGQAGVRTGGGPHPRGRGAGARRGVPLAAAQIYAYQLADLSLRKVMTDAQGNFLFQDLPAGLYKIIAHKAGFVPAVMMLTRTTAQAYQFARAPARRSGRPGRRRMEDDFWALRARVPADVLREIEIAEAPGTRQLTARLVQPGPQRSTLASSFQAEMQALTGVDQIAAGAAGRSPAAASGIKGQVGQTQVGPARAVLPAEPDATSSPAAAPASARARRAASRSTSPADRAAGSTSVAQQPDDDPRRVGQRLAGRLRALPGELVAGRGRERPLRLRRPLHRREQLPPPGRDRSAGHPGASRTLARRGRLHRRLQRPQHAAGGPALPRAPVRPRRRPAGRARPTSSRPSSSIDLFSRGGVRVQPAVLMEYGLYSTLSDGSLALTPQGGVVLQLGSDWQLEATAARRVYRTRPATPTSSPPSSQQRDLCEQGSESCYQMNLTRKVGDDNTLHLRRRPPHGGRHPPALLQRRLLRPRWRASTWCAATSCRSCGVGFQPQALAQGDHQAGLQRGLGRRRHVRRRRRPALREPGALPGDLARHPVPRQLDGGLRRLPPPRAAARPAPAARPARAGGRRWSPSACSSW